MSVPDFDAQGVFDDDYLYFFADGLAERSDAETDLIWRLLDLQPGMEVLDLACGHGRIANRLAERGCNVTGLDATALFLQRARADADALGVTVDYVHADMRDLPWRDRFDRIVNHLAHGNERILCPCWKSQPINIRSLAFRRVRDIFEARPVPSRMDTGFIWRDSS